MMWKAPATGAVATSVIVEDRRQAEREREEHSSRQLSRCRHDGGRDEMR